MAESRSREWDGNHTTVTLFVLLGLSDEGQLQLVFFPIFLGIYILTLTWNLGLILLIKMDSHLHTPMYFFISSLSFTDISYSSSIIPRMVSDLLKSKKEISFLACAIQYFVGAWMGLAECCLLATMAYDQYVAIGNPLLYSAIMAPGFCGKMASGASMSGFFWSLVLTVSCFHLYYCGPNIIENFFCDVLQIISFSCSNPFFSQIVLLLSAVFVGFGSFFVILLSYGFITASVLKMASVKGRSKAFSTCASHLTSVTLYYVTGFSVYMRPSSNHSLEQEKVISVFYVIIIPMLNPLIYSLWNKEIKEALKREIKRAMGLPQ
ncbi:olfactory receptor 5A2-like [Choloepus didactylus]|uniref:olfactory receptor 5A2-like n=1 Tax=Choloepus didactylus TaxID=27675 RepID=UPI00189F29C4|nr:olfactory receptor 5A2-like [Choloepus didactylus]